MQTQGYHIPLRFRGMGSRLPDQFDVEDLAERSLAELFGMAELRLRDLAATKRYPARLRPDDHILVLAILHKIGESWKR